jgi:hypothetical protein
MEQPKPDQQSGSGPTIEHEDWREQRRHRRGGIPGLFAGLLLVWLGITLYLATSGIWSWDTWWQPFIIGLGVIFLIDAAVRYVQNKNVPFVWGRVVTGLILIAVGVIFLLGNLTNLWPVVLVVIGLLILLGAFWRRM